MAGAVTSVQASGKAARRRFRSALATRPPRAHTTATATTTSDESFTRTQTIQLASACLQRVVVCAEVLVARRVETMLLLAGQRVGCDLVHARSLVTREVAARLLTSQLLIARLSDKPALYKH